MRELGIQGLPGPKKAQEEPGERGDRRGPRAAQLQGRRVPTRSGSPTSPNTPRARARSTAARCWISSLVASSAGRSIDAARRALVNDALAMASDSRATRHVDDHPLGPRQSVHVLGLHRERPSLRTDGLHGHRSVTATTTRRWSRFGARCRSSCSIARSGERKSNSQSPSPTTSSTSTTPNAT